MLMNILAPINTVGLTFWQSREKVISEKFLGVARELFFCLS